MVPSPLAFRQSCSCSTALILLSVHTFCYAVACCDKLLRTSRASEAEGAHRGRRKESARGPSSVQVLRPLAGVSARVATWDGSEKERNV
jgi:hypothetical protein